MGCKMKNYLLGSLFIVLFCIALQLQAMPWEVGLKVWDNNNNYTNALVYVYIFDVEGRYFSTSYSGYTESNSDNFAGDVNGGFDIGALDSNTVPYTVPPLGLANYIYIRIGNKYVTLSRTSGAYGDVKLLFQFNSFSVISNNSGYQVSTTQTWADYNITLKNDFGGDRNDVTNVKGKIYLDYIAQNNISYNGQTFPREASTFPHDISGEDNQYVYNYYRKWRNWNDATSEIAKNLTDVQDYNITAIYARRCNISVQNDFRGSGSGGYIKFQNTQYSSPYQPSETYEDLTYSAQALNHLFSSLYI